MDSKLQPIDLTKEETGDDDGGDEEETSKNLVLLTTPDAASGFVVDLCKEDDDDDEDEVVVVQNQPGKRQNLPRKRPWVTTDAAVTTAGCWEVIMMRDRAEQKKFDTPLDQAGIPWETRQLPVFDYLWIARQQRSGGLDDYRVLGYGIERKRADDLLHSLRSADARTGWQRAEHQRLAMNFSGVTNKVLLEEGTLRNVPFLKGSDFQLKVRWVYAFEQSLQRDGFQIKRVPMNGVQQIAEYLKTVHDEIVGKVIAKEIDPNDCMTYGELKEKTAWFIQVGRARKGLRLGKMMIPLVLAEFPSSPRSEYSREPQDVIARLLKIKTDKGRGMSKATAETFCRNLFQNSDPTTRHIPVTPEQNSL